MKARVIIGGLDLLVSSSKGKSSGVISSGNIVKVVDVDLKVSKTVSSTNHLLISIKFIVIVLLIMIIWLGIR